MKKTALIILDGWGIGENKDADAIVNAKTPFFDSLMANHANSKLITFGEDVGLPVGQMGNSEVGHLNIGAGRVVYQDLVKINKACENNELKDNYDLVQALKTAQERESKVHFLGLVSKGGVHSSQAHLYSLCDLAGEFGLSDDQVFIHAFMDGRDTDPHSGKEYMAELEDHLNDSTGQVATVIGRYYAMDRDKRWERVAEAYHLMVNGEGEKFSSTAEAIDSSYKNEITDEFIKASVITDEAGNPLTKIEEGDVVICFNFRTDRCREITQMLSQEDFHEYNTHTLDVHYVTMTEYDKTFKDVNVLFRKDDLQMTLGEVVSKAGLTQTRIAETEKYPHVTFFFSGGRELEFDGEERIMENSPKVATYDLQPEMSAPEVTASICKDIEERSPNFICLNYANPDMVGHTGVFEAVVKACETVDQGLQKVVETGLKNDYSFVVIADHGNADKVFNEDGSPNTAHTTNLVPVIVVDKDVKEINNGRLADVAPTVLDLMGLEQPSEMTGKSLIKK